MSRSKKLSKPLGLLAAALLALPTPAGAASPTFSPDAFRAHVVALADDRMEGRQAGTPGYDAAAAYVAQQFQRIGLKPGGENGGWFQTVTLRTGILAQDRKPKVTLIGPAGTKSWENGSEILFGPSLLDQEQDVSAPVVFAGYGIEAPEHGLNDFAGLDVRGKVVAVLSGTPPSLPGETAAHLSSEKAAMAARRGAIGMITIPTRLSDEAVGWDFRVRSALRPTMTWLAKDGRPVEEAPGLRFTGRFNNAASEALFAGAPRTYAEVRAEAEGRDGRPKGFALPATLRLQRSSVWSEVRSANVIGLLPGGDPRLSGEHVVLTAHLDGLGVDPAAKPAADRIFNGALDNAGGIATMLEAARAFSESGKPPRRSILFIALTAEEKGLLGSDYFARNPTVPAGNVAAVVNLDMPLLLYDFTDVIAFGAEHSTMGPAVDAAAKAMDLRLSPDPMPEQTIFVRSDHYSFVKQGVPSVMLATGFANGGEKQWKGFLSGNYHSVSDDIRQPIDWRAGARFARLNYLVSRQLADADQRPLWYQGNFFGDLFAPKAARAPAPRP